MSDFTHYFGWNHTKLYITILGEIILNHIWSKNVSFPPLPKVPPILGPYKTITPLGKPPHHSEDPPNAAAMWPIRLIAKRCEMDSCQKFSKVRALVYLLHIVTSRVRLSICACCCSLLFAFRSAASFCRAAQKKQNSQKSKPWYIYYTIYHVKSLKRKLLSICACRAARSCSSSRRICGDALYIGNYYWHGSICRKLLLTWDIMPPAVAPPATGSAATHHGQTSVLVVYISAFYFYFFPM